MALKETNWIICYDIRCPKRLQRVHRFCKKSAIPLQKSVFALKADEERLDLWMNGLETLIDPATDDIRIYPVGRLEDAIIYGTTRLPPMMEAYLKSQNEKSR